MSTYKATQWSWAVPSDDQVTSCDGNITLPFLIDGVQVISGDRLDIPILGEGDSIPPPDTLVYLLGVTNMPDGIYRVVSDNKEPQ